MRERAFTELMTRVGAGDAFPAAPASFLATIADLAATAMGRGGLAKDRPSHWGAVEHAGRCHEFGRFLSAWGFDPNPWRGRTRVAYGHPEYGMILKVVYDAGFAFLPVDEAAVVDAARGCGLQHHFPATQVLRPGVQWQQVVDVRNSGSPALDARYDAGAFRTARRLARTLGLTDLHGDNFGYAPGGQRVMLLDWMTRAAMRQLRHAMAALTGDIDGSFLEPAEDR